MYLLAVSASMSATNCWKSSVVEAVDQVLEQTLGSEERRALLRSWFLLAEIDESAGNLLNRAGAGNQGIDGRPESVTMTCSLLRSRTAVTVVVQDWPFRGCTTMFTPTRSEGRAALIARLWPRTILTVNWSAR